MQFAPFIPIAQSISILFHPYAEVIIHDIKKDRIAVIFNSYSKRKVGDPSLLSPSDMIEDNFEASYEKLNSDSRPLKSISTILRNEQKKAIGLMCINFDTSLLHAMNDKLNAFLSNVQKKPESLFINDWQDRINQFVSQYLIANQLHIKALTKQEKKDVIYALYNHSAFSAKGAAVYVATVLDISRATVYKYLSECKRHESSK